MMMEDDEIELNKPHPSTTSRPKRVRKTYLEWRCGGCQKACTHINNQARCICGCRFRDHEQPILDPVINESTGQIVTSGRELAKLKIKRGFKCKKKNCKCREFFYIFGQGHFILRCECKHKHIDHDPNGKRLCNKKTGGKPCTSCKGFHSPWVCNCDHPWRGHTMHYVTKDVTLAEEVMQTLVLDPSTANPHEVKRGEP